MPPIPPVPVCPHCGSPRTGRFCEVDGYDFDTGAFHTVQLITGPVPDQPADQAAAESPPPLIPAQR
ncbi:MAG: hypothetical protein ACRDNL_22315, partial [Spirillospora sp.]